MELSSNSELLRYVTPPQSVEQNECDSFLNEFEVIGRDDDDVANELNNLAIDDSDRFDSVIEATSTKTEDPATISNSSFGSQDDGSQVTSTDVEGMLKVLEEENGKLKQFVEELKETLKTKNDQFKKLVEDVSKAHDEDRTKYEQARLQDLNKVTELQMENLALKEELNKVKARIESLEKELEEKSLEDSKFTELVSLETQLQGKDQEIVLREKKLEDLTSHLEHEKAQNVELKNYIRSANIDELKNELGNCRVRIQELTSIQIERDEQIEILRAQLESLQVTIAKRESALSEKDDAYIPLRKTIDAKQEELNELYRQLAEKNAQCSQINQILEEKKEDYSSLCNMLTDKHEQLEELVRSKEMADDIIQKHQERIFLLEEELRNFKKLLDDFDKENSLLKTRVAALATENESIQYWKVQCEMYQTDYNVISESRNLLNDRIFEMNKEMEELREKNEKQSQELNQLHSTHIRFAQEHINSQEVPTQESGIQTTAQNESQDEKDIFSNVSSVINQLKRGVGALLWDGDRPEEEENVEGAIGGATSNTSLQNDSRQNSSNPAEDNTSGSCPVCGKIFYSFANLQQHSWDCGRSSISAASHLDPFVFVPHQ